jgi:hypothetical protein
MAAKKHRIEILQRGRKRHEEDMFIDPGDDKILTKTFTRLAEASFTGPVRRLDLSEWSMTVRALSGSGAGSWRVKVTCEANGQIRIKR